MHNPGNELNEFMRTIDRGLGIVVAGLERVEIDKEAVSRGIKLIRADIKKKKRLYKQHRYD